MKDLILSCFVGRVTQIEYYSEGFIVHCGRFVFMFHIRKTEFVGDCYDLITNKSAECNSIELVKDCLDDLDTLNYVTKERLFE